MENKSKGKSHWDFIYSTKTTEQLSWTQSVPTTSLAFIQSFQLTNEASIIDVGGGESTLVDHLLRLGYTKITVLDISSAAIERAKLRLGKLADKVNWVVSDILDYAPDTKFDIWHDRATFHFLTELDQIHKYIEITGKGVKKYLTLGTFSIDGPTKCSGLPVKQYDERQLNETLDSVFTKIKCITEDHITPFATRQNFLFCSFRRK